MREKERERENIHKKEHRDTRGGAVTGCWSVDCLNRCRMRQSIQFLNVSIYEMYMYLN